MTDSFYRETIAKLQNQVDLDLEEAERLLEGILAKQFTDLQIGALLVALSVKGESFREIAGFARGMRRHAVPFRQSRPDAVDTAGTGGDARGTFNISTAAALVIAGAGIPVLKHGNRGVSSPCGSADVLKQLGVRIDAPPEQMQEIFEDCGIGFLFAPQYHPAAKSVAPLRQELGIRTIFNLLGPLMNPAGVGRQILGVFSPRWTGIIAEALLLFACQHALVYSAADGLDEISITGPTFITEVKAGKTRSFQLLPEELDLPRGTMADLTGGDAVVNARLLRDLLEGKIGGAKKDIVLLNAAAGILVSGRVATLAEALPPARQSLENGKALEKLERLRELSN
jgi:anthranilate phosphoribosyltransferase